MSTDANTRMPVYFLSQAAVPGHGSTACVSSSR